jgi:twinkle protein
MMIGQSMTSLMKAGQRIGVASFEMLPQALLDRHLRQELGRRPSEYDNYAEVNEILAESKDKYWIYDERHLVTPEKVLGVASHFAGKLKCDHIVIDSLVKCGIKRTPDFAGNLTEFVNQLQSIAKHYNTHIHLVAHLRKGEGEAMFPSKHDIKYAGEITDLAENVLLVWRNKPKEEGKEPDGPDAILAVAKQRYQTFEGKFLLQFDEDFQSWYMAS